MEAADRTACDGDEDEREHLAAKDRATAVDELGHRRHVDLRAQHGDAHRQQQHRAELDEGRKVVARSQQQPDRQHRRGKAVDDDGAGQGQRVVVEQRRQRLVGRHPAATEHRQRKKDQTDGGALEYAARPQVSQVEPDHQRDRDGRCHRAGGPWAVLHSIDDHQPEHSDEDEHDEEGADERRHAADVAELVARHLPDRAAVAAGR